MRALIFFVCTLFLTCGPAATALADMPVVLVIPKEDSQFWGEVHKGAIQAGAERAVKVVFRGPVSPANLKGQLDIIQEGIDDKVHAIVLAPSHTSLAAPLLGKAYNQGIKIVIIDSDMDFKKRVSFVASENYQAGRTAARYLLSLMKDDETLLLVRYRATNKSTENREQGFMDFLRQHNGRINVETLSTDGTVGQTYHHIYEALQPPSQVTAVFSAGEVSAIGVLRALREKGLAGKIKFVCFDTSQEIRDGLAKKEINGTVIQDPYHIGYLGVMAACDAMEGRLVEKRIITETRLITSTDQLPPGQ